MHLVAGSGHELLVRLLLERGADLKVKDKLDRTALHWAAKGGRQAVVELLLYRGADPKVKDYYGRTAELCSSRRVALEVFEHYAQVQMQPAPPAPPAA